MRKSSTVALTLMSGLVGAACSSREPDYRLAERRCVDADQRVVGDSLCARRPAHAGGVGIIPYPYHYYYGGMLLAGRLSGGSTRPHYYTPSRAGGYSAATRVGPNGFTAPATTTARGGFGSSARGYSPASGRGFSAGG